MSSKKVLCLIGAIGVGGSTLTQILAKGLKFNKIVIIPEPVDKQEQSGILKGFYADIKGKAMEFQHYALITRLQAIEKTFKDESNADLYILERSPYCDRYILVEMLRHANFITDAQVQRYNECWQSWQKLLPVAVAITHFIFVNCDL